MSLWRIITFTPTSSPVPSFESTLHLVALTLVLSSHHSLSVLRQSRPRSTAESPPRASSSTHNRWPSLASRSLPPATESFPPRQKQPQNTSTLKHTRTLENNTPDLSGIHPLLATLRKGTARFQLSTASIHAYVTQVAIRVTPRLPDHHHCSAALQLRAPRTSCTTYINYTIQHGSARTTRPTRAGWTPPAYRSSAQSF